MPDRRESAFNDPRFWVSVTAVLLTVSLAVLGFIANKLSSIDGTLQTFMIMSTEQKTRLDQLEKTVADQKADLATFKAQVEATTRDQQAYNFKLGNDLTEIKANDRVKEK